MKKKILIFSMILVSLVLTTSCYRKAKDFNNYREFKYALESLPKHMTFLDNVFSWDLKNLEIDVDEINANINIDYNAVTPKVKAYGYSTSDKMVFYNDNKLLITGEDSKVFFEITLPSNYSFLEELEIDSLVGSVNGSLYASDEISIDIEVGSIDINCLTLNTNPNVDLDVGTGSILVTMPKALAKIKKIKIGVGELESNYTLNKHEYSGEVVATYEIEVGVGKLQLIY